MKRKHFKDSDPAARGQPRNRKDDVKAAGRIRKEGGSDPMANFKDPIHHRRAWAC
ncbi:hypothetical protein SUBVAR_06448 [Subdoligranulum variabile DSM 15176]|uniref:Uncharacterized protein n=1 Tax=Subdoligranulum variabile DSM 15176 TaxID=411471 RepID=D1PPY2_9FIRM|nr:hypothetical protein SUBVAR_06448 [Subdoligranulum variabile DSM 15176]